MKKATAVALLSLAAVNVAAIGAGGYVLNSKMNRQHEALMETNADEVALLQKRLSVVATQKIAAMPFYDFGERVNVDITKYDPAGKYFDWSAVVEMVTDVDQDGVIFTAQRGSANRYDPIQICQYGLEQFSNYVETGDAKFLAEARHQADYIISAIDQATGLLPIPFDYQLPDVEPLKAPWASATAQAQALSLLSRFYKETGETVFLDAAKLAMKPLTVKVASGGVVGEFFEQPFFEEYPTKIPSHALNGMMYAIIGLYDLWQNAADNSAQELYQQGIQTLLMALPYYDANGVSFFWLIHIYGTSLPNYYDPASHVMHVKQLQVIAQLESDPVFDYYLDQWTIYVNGEE
ncbi:MAG: D-glucuronyl C5-epimerase family protein [Micrococcales bacterium]|nr:D-glucuronyl C5-epimerase family protein [Micrococcales bacterium]